MSRFSGFAGQNDIGYLSLDDVRLDAVPEPGSLALMCLGLASFGGYHDGPVRLDAGPGHGGDGGHGPAGVQRLYDVANYDRTRIVSSFRI
jgi:hypothetical protein